MRRALWLAALCAVAFALSCVYLRVCLRGGPRIIDATSYWLEARTLAAGAFTFHAPDPTAAFRGRFLLASPDGHALGVIFPPGYPLVLALGMRLGVPLLVGPALGALLVAVTFGLARALGQGPKVAWLAAGLSVLCAALRYHTADTMSHGLATLLGCTALLCALRRELKAGPILAGLCLGLLVATRPVSATVAFVLTAFALRRAPRNWLALGLGLLPGILLLLAYQHALTGSFFSSTQLAYYALADAPGGCFRYGFGAGIGCHYEHGDYVTRFLPHGYGLGPALRNLGVHLWSFCSDATNAFPLTLLAFYALARHLRSPLALLGGGILLQALAYTPFYFDGHYPGGGARFLCEVIPFAHILVARAVSDLRAPWLAPLGALAGFALYGQRYHAELRDREGGRPMFEPRVVAAAGVTHGLIFAGSDHGFNLGHDPSVTSPAAALFVARRRGDAHDRLLYESLGRPPTYLYRFDFTGQAPPALVPYLPADTARIEAEAEWPALLLAGHAYPLLYPCASGSQALRLLPGTRASFLLSRPPPGKELSVGWLGTTMAGARVKLSWPNGPAREHSAAGPGCVAWRVPGPAPGVPPLLTVELASGEGALDFIDQLPAEPAPLP